MHSHKPFYKNYYYSDIRIVSLLRKSNSLPKRSCCKQTRNTKEDSCFASVHLSINSNFLAFTLCYIH